jgi:hypothetical protein
MANVSRANGFKPIRHISGAPYTGATTRYYVTSANATALGIGDMVSIDGGSDGGAVRSVVRCTATGVPVGPIVSVVVRPTAGLDTPQYVPASTGVYVNVADDPSLLMECQEDAVGGALASTSVGLNCAITIAAASTITGLSAMQLDSSLADTTNTLPLRIVGFSTRQDNEVGSSNAKVIVGFNTHQYRSGTGSTGV